MLPMLPKTPKGPIRGCSAKPWTRSSLGGRCRLRESVELVGQNRDADSLQRFPRAVEDDEGHKRDSADRRGGPLDAAQEQVDDDGDQGDEEHHPDVDHLEARHVVAHIEVDHVAGPAGMEEEQNRPQERDAD
jgi:hypothetical protein